MGKNKNRNKKSEKAGNNAGERASAKKQKQDARPLKDNQEDHLEHIPFRLREIMKSKERMKTGARKANFGAFPKRKPEPSEIEDIPVPHFKKRADESVHKYLSRVQMESEHVLFLTNNQVERKPELDEETQEKPVDHGKCKKKKEYDKLRLQKRKQKKLDQQEAEVEKERFKDDIPFGEVSMEPPSLTSKPRKASIKPQKGTKDLLLNSLLGYTMTSTASPSMARQRIMEEERERAVQAYRLLKKQKLQRQEQARTLKFKALQ
ncbi:coiled-coil domain-containing protein 137 isoform X2 [Nerophis ophidion]|uniref:coiled-coil domain-containing protein 137 isoform X2 n=1 Tax=Nerophis ophidion TaxID=159077 RepID=UPI002ADFFFAC|nr:coiled-coil domain-containing protein 137 isoform X2 [Nerophis ophidion]